MSKKYWLILISFIVMQLSTSLVALLLIQFGFQGTEAELLGTAILITFSIGFVVIGLLALKAKPDEEFIRNRTSGGQTIVWIIAGIFMAYAAQIVAGMIEMYVFGIEPGSENTQVIVDWANAVPLLIIVVAVLVPIMEEIVFRMVIFGSLYKRFGFWIAALLSGFIFAVVHMDFEHLLVYLAMGIVFAWLYVKTKRIIVPIMAHVGINSFVMLVQVIFGEQLQDLIEQMEEMEAMIQAIIGGLF
ncbi:CPBP family intramembrane metalloprotease [Evansella sp. LMS18]|uniref:CPBP family intramembrane glutamic endopeptidase n=1 Tax=Evansella sp. LMS18 TaxID=2924033 RepID=UPI0020D0F15D|nr:type II CAAX endopeptidase family protein [Evansella sp. LMS18]UTR08749.1 CPBP family intramembrane metalloprotease [Evansella sp. LMS18]